MTIISKETMSIIIIVLNNPSIQHTLNNQSSTLTQFKSIMLSMIHVPDLNSQMQYGIIHIVKNKLWPFLSFRGSNWAWKSESLHLNNWATNLGFALCNQLNQVDQMTLIKAHPFLLSSNCIYQWKLYFILYQKQIQLLGVRALGKTFFLSTVLHFSPSFHFCSSFFLYKFHGFSTGDDHGRLNT